MPDTEERTGKFTFGRGLPFADVPTPLTAPEPPPLLSEHEGSIVPETMSAPCANCGESLVGPYCAECGQHVADFHRSVWRFVADFLDNTFCWDNKFLRTLKPLFRQPGFLTKEFMSGRRVRYVHPLRLFLFTSAVCLTLLQFSHSQFVHFDDDDPGAARKSKGHVKVDAGLTKPIIDPSSSAEATPEAAAASVSSATPAAAKEKDDDDDNSGNVAAAAIKQALAGKIGPNGKALPADLGERITKSVEEKIAKGGGVKRLNQTISEGIQNRLSWVALGLLPVFAFLLRAVYWREDTYYFAHLVFSLHYHTFLLLFWTGYVALQFMTAHLPLHSLLDTLLAFSLLLPPIYLYKALRLFYGDGRKRAAVKALVVGGVHLLAIVIGISAVGAAAFFSATK